MGIARIIDPMSGCDVEVLLPFDAAHTKLVLAWQLIKAQENIYVVNIKQKRLWVLPPVEHVH